MTTKLSFLKGRVFKNASWLIGGNIIHKFLAFVVSVLTARYLGPSNYGLINYAAAYTTFFFSLSTLGINSILIKEFVDDPENEGVTLGTTLMLQCLASALSICCIFLIVYVVDYGELQTIVVVLLSSLGLFFQTLDSVRYWFQSKLESKYTAIASVLAYAIASIYKIGLLFCGASVEWFAIATSIDHVCVALFLMWIYKKKNGSKLHISVKKAKELLKKGHHFILSGLMISIYGATDRLMLKQLLDESAVGYYGTAVSICNVWVFILSAIIDSFKPVIMQTYTKDKFAFEKKNRFLYAIIFYCSVFVSLCITVFAEMGVLIVYGKEYLPSVSVLRIATWYVAFSYLGVARDTWIVCENQQKYLFKLYMGAAAINVVLNAVLIPTWGANGAAIASLITQISTILVFPCFIKALRPNVKLMLEAITLRKLR